MKRILLLIIILSFAALAGAHLGEDEYNHTEELIASNTPCSELTDDQIAAIGDYYMEQMHPGEMHDIMDEHMGGEGTEELRQAHISIGENNYCDQFETSGQQGWMPMMGGGMWGTGTMGWFGALIWLGILALVVLGTIYLVRPIREKHANLDEPVPDNPDNGEGDE